ncbi:MAG: HD domain-containing protein [Fimbriiglobus sp.]
MHDFSAILAVILEGYTLPVDGLHGLGHWARVQENGLHIAEDTGADPEIVRLFALFHDARRVNEVHDPGHGLRGGELARSLRGTLIHLDDDRFELLFEACRLHTDGHTTGDVTLLTCWDADRLDLGRVGILPDPKRLGTKAARAFLPQAHHHATTNHQPSEVMRMWGRSVGFA